VSLRGKQRRGERVTRLISCIIILRFDDNELLELKVTILGKERLGVGKGGLSVRVRTPAGSVRLEGSVEIANCTFLIFP
jgi:hypothetical protein